MHSEHESFKHPNEMTVDETRMDSNTIYSSNLNGKKKKKKNQCKMYCRRFDKLIMKPMFVYNYKPSTAKLKDDFVEMFMKQGQELEDLFISNDN